MRLRHHVISRESRQRMNVSRTLGFTAGAVLGGLSAAAAYGTVSRSSQMFGPSVYRGPGRRKSIALTFDDGPSEGTSDLLEYLEKEGVTATFFECGMHVKRLPHVAGQVAAAGHEIGNHSYSHPKLPFKSREFIDREFTEAQRVIEGETGVTPLLLRAPYGFRWMGLRQVQERLLLLGVMWTVIGYDWRWPAKRISEYVLRNSSPGGIICLHDGRGASLQSDISNTIEAVKEIVPILRDQGYRFETVSALLDY
jgi:peptidoglycan/xylan/chitin deacetylase (PgdA/CDA1 family)